MVMAQKTSIVRGKKDKILVLAIDRDNDIGEKTRIKGPLVGREAAVKAAVALGTADPSDSDTNAVFQSVKVFDDLKKQYTTELAVLTGHRNVGIQSDKIIADQLNSVMKKFKADYAVLVSDGAEDEHVVPIIQSRVPILSVNKIIVKQAEALESSYYKIKDFISESLENPKFSSLIFGLPALILVLFAIFGTEGTRAVLGILGAYLLVKGFKLEGYFTGAWEEVHAALSRKRFAFFMYTIAGIFFVLASYQGVSGFFDFVDVGFFESVAGFFSPSIYFYFISAALVWIGRNIVSEKRNVKKITSMIIFGLSIALVISSAAELILNPETSLLNFVLAIIAGFVLIFLAVYLEIKGKGGKAQNKE